MIKLYLISSIAAISFFSFAQYRGLTVFPGGSAQQFARTAGTGGSGGSFHSSTISHK